MNMDHGKTGAPQVTIVPPAACCEWPIQNSKAQKTPLLAEEYFV
jgi:hypothetical protein